MIQPVFENIEEEILERLNNCKYAVHVAMAWATNTRLLKKLIELKQNKVDVRLIVSDDGEINAKSTDLFSALNNGNPSVFKAGSELWVGNNLMHHKFCIIDYETVITGSFNWTHKAENSNDENIVILDDVKTANEYSEEFFNVLTKAEPYFNESTSSESIVFRAKKLLLIKGETTFLIWNVQNATVVKLNGVEVSNSGEKEVSITDHKVFILTAEFEDGIISKEVLIEYCKVPKLSLELDREFVIENHQPLKLSWKVENAEKVYLHPFGEVEAEGTKTEFLKEAQIFYIVASNRRAVKKTELKECKVVSLSKIEQIDTPFPDLDLNLSIDLSEIQKSLGELKLEDKFDLNLAQSFDELKTQVYVKNEIVIPDIDLGEGFKSELMKKVRTKLFKKGENE